MPDAGQSPSNMDQWHCFTYQLELELTMILLAAEQCLTLLCPLLAQATFWHEVPALCLPVTVYRTSPALGLLPRAVVTMKLKPSSAHAYPAINNGTSFSPELSRICLW